MVYIIIIQARMGSTRLPGKVMKKLLDKEIILWAYDRCVKSKAKDVFIATSLNEENDILAELCNKKGIKYYRGSEQDLLDRYYQLSKLYYQVSNNFKDTKELKIIRITSDCPFVDPRIINDMIDFYENNNVNYIINHNSEAITPEGSCVEIIDFASLEYLWNTEKDPTIREHATGLLAVLNKYNDVIKVHKYAYLPKNSINYDYFNDYSKNYIKHLIKDLNNDFINDFINDYDKIKLIKLSIDTIKDYENALSIVNHFKNYDFSYLEVLIYIYQNSLNSLNSLRE